MTSQHERAENIARQADEIEALTAIYEDEWKIEDPFNRAYSISISTTNNEHTVLLQVTLPPDYPSKAPPYYQLSAPWMSRQDKSSLTAELEELYCDNPGESIIYLWIESIRNFLEILISKRLESERSILSDDNEHAILNELSSMASANSDTSNEEINLYHGDPLVDRRSTFQAHLAPVASPEQVKQVLNKLKENRKIASATHNIFAYRIYEESRKTMLQDCDDDGETNAGSRLLHLLQILNVQNILIVVSRWYGGIQLGPDRFKHINNTARSILQKCGYIQAQKSGKKK